MCSIIKKYKKSLSPTSHLLTNLNLNEKIPKANGVSFCLLGFACDEGVRRNNGRPGAFEGPSYFRKQFTPSHHIYDCGDIICEDQNLEASQESLGIAIARLLQAGYTPIVIGGGHELSWGIYLGIQKVYPGECQIINYDAHYDLRPLDSNIGSTSGTSFSQIQEDCHIKKIPFCYSCLGIQPNSNSDLLKERAKAFDVETIYAKELKGDTHSKESLHAKSLYLSICLDVFASNYAPGVSAPQQLGIKPDIAFSSIIGILRNNTKPVIFSIAELSPKFDLEGITNHLAIQLVNNLISASA